MVQLLGSPVYPNIEESVHNAHQIAKLLGYRENDMNFLKNPSKEMIYDKLTEIKQKAMAVETTQAYLIINIGFKLSFRSKRQ